VTVTGHLIPHLDPATPDTGVEPRAHGALRVVPAVRRTPVPGVDLFRKDFEGGGGIDGHVDGPGDDAGQRAHPASAFCMYSANQRSVVCQPYIRFCAATSGGNWSRPRCSSVTRVPSPTASKRTSTAVSGSGGALETRSANTRRAPGSQARTFPKANPAPV